MTQAHTEQKQTLKIDGKLAVRAGKLTKYGMGIINTYVEQGYHDDPYMIASITDINTPLIIEFLAR